MSPRSSVVALFLLAAAAIGVGAVVQYFARPAEPLAHPHFLRASPEVAPFLRADVKSPAAAKRRRLFWMETTGGESFGLDALRSPALFRSLFPGYPEAMRLDQALWQDYFQRTFEIETVTTATAESYAPEFNVILSWTGCLDIYRRYGADVVVLGTSETFHSVVPDELARLLANGRETPRTLLCTATAMQVDTATEIARRLKELRPDLTPTVLYGLSQSVAFVEGKRNIRNGLEKLATLADFDLQTARSRGALVRFFEAYHEISFADLFPKLTWDDVFPHTAGSRAEAAWIRGYARAARRREFAKVKGGFVPASLRQDPVALRSDIEARLRPYYRVYDDYLDERHCHSSARTEALARLGDAFRALTPKVFLFIPPTSPLASLAATECFRRAVAHDLERLGERLRAPVRTDDWEAYGLTYADFVRPTLHPEVYKLDIQHANYHGALKITRALGRWMKEAR